MILNVRWLTLLKKREPAGQPQVSLSNSYLPKYSTPSPAPESFVVTAAMDSGNVPTPLWISPVDPGTENVKEKSALPSLVAQALSRPLTSLPAFLFHNFWSSKSVPHHSHTSYLLVTDRKTTLSRLSGWAKGWYMTQLHEQFPSSQLMKVSLSFPLHFFVKPEKIHQQHL